MARSQTRQLREKRSQRFVRAASSVLRQRFRARDDRAERVERTVDAFDVRVLRPTRSGNRFAPVSRFHSSKVSFEILPSTRSCANFRRCA
jgi:hypothetical protein